ncbi:MAG: diguanylate cyclase [Candidatus Omnitrophica bacterium]|nr:diguanylate cyclase [Candidatus Omnitrophota bacterium]
MFSKTVISRISIVGVITACIIAACGFQFASNIENAFSDVFFRIKGNSLSTQPINIIEITNADIDKIGRWPWKRMWHAAMTKVLTDLGAKVIYFDVIFSEKADDVDDALFAEAIKASGKVYLPYIFSGKNYDNDSALYPIERFSSSVKNMGSMNIYPDMDGSIRRMPMVFLSGKGEASPHVVLRMASDYLGQKIDTAEIKNEKLILSGAPGRNAIVVPLIDHTNLLINWRGTWTKSFRHYDFLDVLAAFQKSADGEAPDMDLKVFKNSICLIGISAYGLYDIKPVPVESEYPGIGIIANALDTILSKSFMRVLPFWMGALIMVVISFLLVFILQGKNPVIENIFVAILVCGYLVASYLVFVCGYKLPVFTVLFSTLLNSVALGTYNFVCSNIEKKQLLKISITDGLTGLYNIRYAKMMLENEIQAVLHGMTKVFSIIMCDLDHFKRVNDTYGHQIGDLVLKETASVLKTSVRGSDIVARYGGEEMLVILRSTTLEYALEIGEKIRLNIQNKEIRDEKQRYPVTSSVGVSSYIKGDTLDSVIKRADEALYVAKEKGRNIVCTIQNKP